MSGSTIMPTVVDGNSTLAMGMPLARLFLEPQNTMVISSGVEKPAARADTVLIVSATASSSIETRQIANSDQPFTWLHMPFTTAALKAV